MTIIWFMETERIEKVLHVQCDANFIGNLKEIIELKINELSTFNRLKFHDEGELLPANG